jgi:hypothetical protein
VSGSEVKREERGKERKREVKKVKEREGKLKNKNCEGK